MTARRPARGYPVEHALDADVLVDVGPVRVPSLAAAQPKSAFWVYRRIRRTTSSRGKPSVERPRRRCLTAFPREARHGRVSCVMLAARLRGQPQMAADLAGDSISEYFEVSSEITPRDISGQSHRARTSSLTRWSRMTLGPRASSK